jgi:Mrp family chromosome partitioning ATPase
MKERIMFGKSTQSPVAPRQIDLEPVTDAEIQLAAHRSEAVYHLPHELIDSLRHLVTKMSRAQKMPQRLAVVSALRQEGVSYVTQALATIMAHDLNRRICLVDLNWWWPSIQMRELARYYPGMLPTMQRPVIARGVALQNAIIELSKHFDHLILDVPAILSSSDAIPLASLGDACCLVVQQGISSRSTVKRATTEIDHLPMLGVVMNRVQVSTPPWLLRWIPQD